MMSRSRFLAKRFRVLRGYHVNDAARALNVEQVAVTRYYFHGVHADVHL